MEKYQIFFPSPPSPSASTTLGGGVAGSQAYFNDNENGKAAETGIQLLDAKMISQGGASGSSEIKGKTKEFKKHRYAFQTRSQVDILDDGYRWRKYGQKTVKNNKFPRSYYKCTHNGCPVKKQVQRNSKDEGVVVTTYEGMHTHSTERSIENFEDILRQMQTYTPF
ncbi:putative WRKY transcription factor 75 [Turnera subulata]|uniref:WRKY transcription factor 75 n=1 Tax=Turnera subulata TaxID=218843 RepID=A0A9Q0JD19_9ROSI|nr:putative WRKY transcription factor 75 [Turnera subulata]